nr:SusD/RagB family nutrient-binding outer membrane lipoprotein [Mucilaginibacter sp. L294]
MRPVIKTITRLTATILLFLTVFGCNKFGDLNTDPTKSSNLDPVNQLMFAQLWFSGDLNSQERTSYFLLIPMMQQLNGAYNTRYGALYVKEEPFFWGIWENSYGNDVANIVDAVARTNGVTNQSNLNAMCRIMKVYTFARLTDLFGDLPYFEAGKAFRDGVKKPKYDEQKDIYDDFLKELSAASAQLDASKDKVSNEIFYKGDIPSWKKFANSLRLRLALRLVKRDPERAKKEVQAAFDAGVFTSNADICMTRHEDISNNYQDIRGNSVSVSFNTKNQMTRICTTFLNQLKSTDDPRLNYLVRCYKENGIPSRFLEREDITAQIKAKNGLIGSDPGRYIYEDELSSSAITLASGESYVPTNVDLKCQLNHNLLRNNAPFLHLTYAEVELLLADATVRLGLNLGGSAQTHYQKGIEAAMQQLSLYPSGPVVPASEISGFIANNPLAAGRELEQINTQLWIALLLNGPETYANWRRSGFPALVPSPSDESTSLTIPRRFQYPLSEKEQNAQNVQAAIQRIGEDDWLKRVWWDQQ